MGDDEPLKPYGSARDLPSMVEMESQISALRLLGIFLPKEQREKLVELERESRRITVLVDSFYELLGSRNWVFTGDLDLSAAKQIVDASTTEIAEAKLVSYYQEDRRISFPLKRLRRFHAMRPRLDLLQKALEDYAAGRFYSTTLVLLATMDGFVNDLDPQNRRGLHARDAEAMVAWDSIVGHHKGLSHAHQTFRKGFSKTDSSEVTELYRNGIMHGNLTNFNNEIVATKAWNRLFAVTDWADARTRRSIPREPAPNLGDLLAERRVHNEQMKLLRDWRPREYTPDLTSEELPEVVRTCEGFLEKWRKRQWGPLGRHFLQLGSPRRTIGELALLAKDLYSSLELTAGTIRRVRHQAAGVAHTEVDLIVNGSPYHADLRWVHLNEQGDTSPEWEIGEWTLSIYGPTNFLKQSNSSSEDPTSANST